MLVQIAKSGEFAVNLDLRAWGKKEIRTTPLTMAGIEN
jgi:hypothetical protein